MNPQAGHGPDGGISFAVAATVAEQNAYGTGPKGPARKNLKAAMDNGFIQGPTNHPNIVAANYISVRPESAGPPGSRPGTSQSRFGSPPRTAGGTAKLPRKFPAKQAFPAQAMCRIELPAILCVPSRTSDSVRPTDAERYAINKKIADTQILARACGREGRQRLEGRSYYTIGILYDNLHEWGTARKYYNKFLKVCKTCLDSSGEALAYHCLGVGHFLLAERAASTSVKADLLNAAELYHKKHRDMADVQGKFVANLNLGNTFRIMAQEAEANSTRDEYLAMLSKAKNNFEAAKRQAELSNNIEGVNVAAGNLAFLPDDAFASAIVDSADNSCDQRHNLVKYVF